MYKTILSLLIALLVITPCLAQGVKAEEPATLEGTEWKFKEGGVYGNIPPITDDSYAFYGGMVYQICPIWGCAEAHQPDEYVSGKKLGLFRVGHRPDSDSTPDKIENCENYDDLVLGIMSLANKVGIIYYESGCFLARKRGVAVLEKVSDNWKPPEGVE